jgi:colanic acid biosynthesis glycosyl transferase WcaI
MKILMYCLNYAPELTGIGKYTSEQAEWLAAQGHEVRVITAPPYYPEWKIGNGYKAWQYRREHVNGVTILRAPLWVPRVPSGLKRLIHLASFALSSLPLLFAQTRWKPDVIFTVEPPLFCSPASLLFGKLSGSKTWLHIQDYEIDAAFALGLLKSQKLRELVLRAERWLLKKFDRVSTISQAMMRLAQAKGVDASRLVHFRNWVDIQSITPGSTATPFRNQLGIPLDAVVALYSGNMGAKQGLEVLGAAARELKDNTEIHFIFCGDGPGKTPLEQDCANLERVHFLPLQPVESLSTLLATANIHLLPQRADAADLVMPSKLTGMLASGRPTIATAHPETEVAATLASCGLIVAPDSPAALASAIFSLSSQQALRQTLGSAARKYAEEYLAMDRTLRRFVKSACEVLNSKSAAKEL